MKTVILAVLGFLAFTAMGLYSGVSFAQEKAVAKPFGYKIERGDNLTKIAKRFNTTKNEILSINKGNPCIKNKNLIFRGCTLYINDLFPEKEVAKLFTAHKKDVVLPLLQEKAQLKKANSTQTVLLMGVGGVAALLFMGLLAIMISLASFKERIETEKAEAIDALNGQLTSQLAELDRTRLEKGALFVELAVARKIVQFEAKNGQIIEFDIAKVKCKFKDCDTEVSPQNALSHYFQQHGQAEEPEPKETVDRA